MAKSCDGEHDAGLKERQANVIREMINQESVLINDRLTWLVQLQALLFAALAFAWKDAASLVPILVTIGIAISLSVLVPLLCAAKAITRLVKDANKCATFPPVIGYELPKMWCRSLFTYILPWYSVPVIFTAGWIWVLLKH